jgi:catechol-2,3-dioxygenase
LDKGRKYAVTVYKDGPGADWKANPEAYVIETMTVDSKSVLNVKLAPGGGVAVSLMAL